MKLGSMSKMLAGATLAFVITGGVVAVQAAPRPDSGQSDQKKALYPNATREAPELDLHKKSVADKVNKGLDAVNSGDAATAKKLLTPIAAGEEGDSKYAQVLALQGLANVKYRAGDVKGGITALQKALKIGVMPNDTYFQLMYELAQFYAASEQDQKALDTLHKWRKEGRRETANSYGLEGVLDYRLGKYEAAIKNIKKAKSMTDQPKQTWSQVLAASYAESGNSGEAIAMAKKQLAADPDDATTRHNLIVLLMRSNKYDEAIKQMEQARSKGQLTTSQNYINLAKLYLITGQNSGEDPKPYADKALAVLKEGLSKGIVKTDYDYYKLKGDAALVGGDRDQALAAYTKAAPLGTDGRAELRRAELLSADKKYSDSRDAARKAIAKGTKHKGQAYLLIARAERGMNNKSAAVKAMKKAAQYPETSAKAKAWLKQAGH
ncbi:MAG TPA: tetratricopeptide repeat protein [Oleiagrimonas sp.]|nr:tetratricopeptide repeat protein [Oleiagrimonas sp.]